jgi:Origin recognition complex, subunit 2
VDNHYNNLLITGVGSKTDFLNDFAEECLSEYPIITINGYMNGITLKYILNKLCNFLTPLVKNTDSEDAIDEETNTKIQKRTKVQQLEFIKDVLSGREEGFKYNRVILIIHNLDGKALRSDDTQQILSEIAKLQKVKLTLFS